MTSQQKAKKKLELALQEYVRAQYDDHHFLGDWVLSCVVVNLKGSEKENNYLHDGSGAFHSMRGLTEEQADWLIELKEEEKRD